eukprot:4210938-Pyramimonas_sp.AAC.1
MCTRGAWRHTRGSRCAHAEAADVHALVASDVHTQGSRCAHAEHARGSRCAQAGQPMCARGAGDVHTRGSRCEHSNTQNNRLSSAYGAARVG